MRSRTVTALAIMILVSGLMLLGTVRVRAADPSTVPISELEDELTDIEQELTGLERQIDALLEDLVDPKITSLSVFFSSQSIRGHVPASIQVQLDDQLLTNRKFDETDRLLLVRGGALEVYSGVTDPAFHDLTVECFLTSEAPQGGIISSGKATFKFEARRAVANFLEITLAEDPAKKADPYKLSARNWSKEP